MMSWKCGWLLSWCETGENESRDNIMMAFMRLPKGRGLLHKHSLAGGSEDALTPPTRYLEVWSICWRLWLTDICSTTFNLCSNELISCCMFKRAIRNFSLTSSDVGDGVLLLSGS